MTRPAISAMFVGLTLLTGDNPHAFDDLTPAFTDRFRVIAYAQRGHGNSEVKEPYDTATMTEEQKARRQ